MVDLTKDLDVFLNKSDFAVDATYTPAGGSASTVTGNYDENPLDDSGEAMVGDGESQPTFLCKTTSVPNAAKDDLLTVNGVNYKVVLVPKPEDGFTTLILEKN